MISLLAYLGERCNAIWAVYGVHGVFKPVKADVEIKNLSIDELKAV
jgi:hypothetical protein